MKFRTLARKALAAFALISANAHAVYIVYDDQGRIAGATNVIVEGHEYDVSFGKSSADDLHPFNMQGAGVATNALNALLTQIFDNGARFYSNGIAGCSGLCQITIPYGAYISEYPGESYGRYMTLVLSTAWAYPYGE